MQSAPPPSSLRCIDTRHWHTRYSAFVTVVVLQLVGKEFAFLSEHWESFCLFHSPLQTVTELFLFFLFYGDKTRYLDGKVAPPGGKSWWQLGNVITLGECLINYGQGDAQIERVVIYS